jgi:dienelactone hydrolase
VPTLVLKGDRDNESPHTEAIVQDMRSTGSPIELKLYKGGHHQFDDPTLPPNGSMRTAFGIRVMDKYDSSLARQSRTDTFEFLAKHLK